VVGLTLKSPQPSFTKGGFKGTISVENNSSSPFAKGGSRGILLRFRLSENFRSIFTPQARLNYNITIKPGLILKLLSTKGKVKNAQTD
jgi:hypothetical protein